MSRGETIRPISPCSVHAHPKLVRSQSVGLWHRAARPDRRTAIDRVNLMMQRRRCREGANAAIDKILDSRL